MYIWPSITIQPSNYLSGHLTIQPSNYLSLSNYLSIHLTIYLSNYLRLCRPGANSLLLCSEPCYKIAPRSFATSHC